MGKMLMAKCRTLQEENEEIGAMASEGKVMSSIGQAPTTTIPANLGEHARQVGKLSSEHLMPVTTLASVQMNLTSGSILKSDTLPSTCACALMLMTMNWRCLKLSIIFSWSWTVTSVCELDLIFNFHKGMFYSGRGTACRSYSGDEQENCKTTYSCTVVEGSSIKEWRRHRKPQFSMKPQL